MKKQENVLLRACYRRVGQCYCLAIDEFGNVGISKTITFSFEAPFPTIPVAVASVASVAVVTAGLLIYLRKRKES